MKSGVVVIALYDGLSATRDFLLAAHIPIVRYVSVEIDPVARRMADWRYQVGFADTQPPNDRFLGDDVNALATKWGRDMLRCRWGRGEGVLVVGGIPCTSLSTANTNHKGAGRLAAGTATGDGVRAFAAVLDALPEAKWLAECTPSNLEDSIFDHYLGCATRLNAAYWTPQCRRRDLRAGEKIDLPETRGISPAELTLGDVVDFGYKPKKYYPAVVWPGRCENILLYPRRVGVLTTPACVRAMLGVAAGERTKSQMSGRGSDVSGGVGQSPAVLSGGKRTRGKSSVPLAECPLPLDGRVVRAYGGMAQSEALPSASGMGKPSVVAVNPNLEFGGKQSAGIASQSAQAYALSSGKARYRGRGNYSALEVENERALRECVSALPPEIKTDMVKYLRKAGLWQGWTLARVLTLPEAARLFGYREKTIIGAPLSSSAIFRLLGQSFPPAMMGYALDYALGTEKAAVRPLFPGR